MSRRFLVIALVFAVGFGVGYGATWLLVGSPDKTPAPATVAGGNPTREPTAAPTKPATTTAATNVAEADAASAEPTTAPTNDSDAAVAPEGDAVAAAPDAVEPVADAEATTPVEADTAVAAADTVAAPEPDAAVQPTTWWDACKGRVCVVDWGRVSGGISVREGSIEHGQDVDWATTFAKAEKVGTLEAKKNMKLEVLGVGMSEGKPVAAWIKFKNLKGVIALSFGDKQITFKAPND